MLKEGSQLPTSCRVLLTLVMMTTVMMQDYQIPIIEILINREKGQHFIEFLTRYYDGVTSCRGNGTGSRGLGDTEPDGGIQLEQRQDISIEDFCDQYRNQLGLKAKISG